MKEKIELNKKQFAKNQYEKVIDTSFSQLANTPSTSNTSAQTPSISIDEFFQYYNELFFQIPKFGETNSHEFLIKQSSEYIDFDSTNNIIQALVEEINLLQQQNLELNKKLVDTQLSNK